MNDTGHLFPIAPKPGDKPKVEKLIDINHYLMRRVEELEEIIRGYMEREVYGNLKSMSTSPEEKNEE